MHDPQNTINKEEILVPRFSKLILENLKEMFPLYYIHKYMFIKFKSSITHCCTLSFSAVSMIVNNVKLMFPLYYKHNVF